MNPEDRALLERTAKLVEENHKMLHQVERRAHMAMIWGFIKLALIVVPIVAGYVILLPYLGTAVGNFKDLQGLIKQQ